MAPTTSEQPDVPTSTAIPVSLGDLDELSKRANGGDERAVLLLRQLLDEHPEIWRNLGELSRHAEAGIINSMGQGNRVLAESIQRRAAEMRSELAGDVASPLERLAVDRVVTAWLALQYAESRHPKDESSPNLALIRYLEQLKSGAQRRFDAAMKSLLLVREKLAVIQRSERPMLKILRTGT